jgi:hypothetical protein
LLRSGFVDGIFRDVEELVMAIGDYIDKNSPRFRR